MFKDLDEIKKKHIENQDFRYPFDAFWWHIGIEDAQEEVNKKVEELKDRFCYAIDKEDCKNKHICPTSLIIDEVFNSTQGSKNKLGNVALESVDNASGDLCENCGHEECWHQKRGCILNWTYDVRGKVVKGCLCSEFKPKEKEK